MKPLRVYQGECDWVIAESESDAASIAQELYGPQSYDSEGYDRPCHWTALPDEKPLTILDDDDRSGPKTTKTCAEWIAERGRGFLCTTEF